MANPLQKNQEGGFWSRLSPQRKQLAVIMGLIVGFVIITYPFLSSGPGAKKVVQSSLNNILTGADTHDLGMGGLSKQVEELGHQVAEMQKSLKDAGGQRVVNTPQSNEANELLTKRLAQLENDVRNRALPNGAPTSSTNGANGLPAVPGTAFASQGGPGAQQLQQQQIQQQQQLAASRLQHDGAAAPPPRIRTIEENPGDAPSGAAGATKQGAVNAATAKAQAAAAKAYIPSGSILSGVLITGLDAPTGRGSTQDPIPVLIRLKHEAILPNRFRADFRECFMIAAGFGDLSSERAYLRAESISCVRNDGKVIDNKIEAYAVGEDGKAGMRGHLVSKQGQAILKAAIAGFAQSYAQALQPNNSAGVAGGGFTGAGLQEGAYGGAGAALDRVAKFYIDTANQMFPVIEIDAARQVSMVAVKGVSLALVQ